MALSGDALASLEQVKAYLDKTSTDDDALLEGPNRGGQRPVQHLYRPQAAGQGLWP